MSRDDRERVIMDSWESNAAAWTAAVRGQHIPSRRAGTDAAIVRACERLRPKRVLDVGCGEGWLTRVLAETAEEVVGIDGSSDLIAQARAAGSGRFEVVDYETLLRDSAVVQGPWDLIVCNYCLLGDPLAPLLSVLGSRLGLGGRLVIQTVHPWRTAGDGQYSDGWREETFANFGVAFPAAMPWYFRTLESWFAELQLAGLVVSRLEEPIDATTGQPLSIIFECAAAFTTDGRH